MIKLTVARRIIIAVLGVVLLVLVLSFGLKHNFDQTAVIPASIAVHRALAIANEQGPYGEAVTPPVEARGQATTYAQAIQFIFGRPLDPQESAAYNPNFPVWLVVLRGQFVEHVPPSADGSIPAKDVLHSQMAIILDGDSTQNIESVMLSPTQPLDVSSLPVLPLPTGAPEATTTPFTNPDLIPTPTEGP